MRFSHAGDPFCCSAIYTKRSPATDNDFLAGCRNLPMNARPVLCVGREQVAERRIMGPDGIMADAMTIDTALRPIDGPSAWRGDALTADPSWRRTLTAGEVAALERAAEAAASHGVPSSGFGPAEFPVLELQPVFGWLADQLENGPGVARLSGVPVDRMTREALRRLFWGFVLPHRRMLPSHRALPHQVRSRCLINLRPVPSSTFLFPI
jgi:hypothetical protein